jgi:hypothetical protein
MARIDLQRDSRKEGKATLTLLESLRNFVRLGLKLQRGMHCGGQPHVHLASTCQTATRVATQIKANIIFSINTFCAEVNLMGARIHGRPFPVTVM